MRHHSLPTVDFCTLHSYPDQWLQCGASDEACVVGFARSWFASHLEACASLRKPLLLEEFGLRVPAWPISARDALFEAAFGQALASVRAGGPAAGAMFWLLAPTATTPDYDGYTVYTGTSTAQLVMQAADNMAALG